jgi:rubredoxin
MTKELPEFARLLCNTCWYVFYTERILTDIDAIYCPYCGAQNAEYDD